MKTLSDLYSVLKEYAFYEAAGFAMLFVLTVLLYMWQSRRLRSVRERSQRVNFFLEHVQATKGIEKNIDSLLEILGSLVDAPVYAFYIFDSKNRQYVLKGVRHMQTDFGQVRPSYSGLAPYKKETYMPPTTLNHLAVPSNVELVNEGEVPLIVVPLGGIGVIRIGPVRKVSRKTRKSLSELSMQIQYVLPELILAENMRNQVEVVVASGKALQNISDVVLDSKATIDLVMRASIRALDAFGGFYCEKRHAGWTISTTVGLSADALRGFESDETILHVLLAKAEGKGSIVFKQGEIDFYELPEYILTQGTRAISVAEVGQRGLLVVLFNKIPKMDEEEAGNLGMIASDLLQVIDSQAPLQHLSKVYINILKRLARTMDNLNPYTIGYSDQMSRYAIIIAKELGLPEDEVRDIALAAFLSNIGVLGLSSELYQKEGKYTEAEYEMMKLHSEVGASVISVTTGNKNVASYIMHHHERMDGAGYPAGLRGADIPIGARIIAVVQTFLAKINGRKQRDPLPFDKALQMLVSASGTQLDKQVVEALISWFHKKRVDRRFNERSLGNCWEMFCTPSSVCEHCPVYQQGSDNISKCWDVEGNLCSAHGKSCATCFVHTEFLTRTTEKQRA